MTPSPSWVQDSLHVPYVRSLPWISVRIRMLVHHATWRGLSHEQEMISDLISLEKRLPC